MPSLRSLSLPSSCAESVVDLSGLTTLTALHLERCAGVADEEVLTLSHLEGL